MITALDEVHSEVVLWGLGLGRSSPTPHACSLPIITLTHASGFSPLRSLAILAIFCRCARNLLGSASEEGTVEGLHQVRTGMMKVFDGLVHFRFLRSKSRSDDVRDHGTTYTPMHITSLPRNFMNLESERRLRSVKMIWFTFPSLSTLLVEYTHVRLVAQKGVWI